MSRYLDGALGVNTKITVRIVNTKVAAHDVINSTKITCTVNNKLLG